MLENSQILEDIKTNKKSGSLIFFWIIIIVCLFIYFTAPMIIVGNYPRLSALIIWVLFFFSVLSIITAYAKNKPNKKDLFLTISILVIFIGAGGAIPGVLMTGIKFKHTKIKHLNKYGIIANARIQNKEIKRVSRRGKESNGFKLFFIYVSKKGNVINSWDIVSEDEFFMVKERTNFLVIYSSKYENIVDIIISEESHQDYKANLNDYPLKSPLQ